MAYQSWLTPCRSAAACMQAAAPMARLTTNIKACVKHILLASPSGVFTFLFYRFFTCDFCSDLPIWDLFSISALAQFIYRPRHTDAHSQNGSCQNAALVHNTHYQLTRCSQCQCPHSFSCACCDGTLQVSVARLNSKSNATPSDADVQLIFFV